MVEEREKGDVEMAGWEAERGETETGGVTKQVASESELAMRKQIKSLRCITVRLCLCFWVYLCLICQLWFFGMMIKFDAFKKW